MKFGNLLSTAENINARYLWTFLLATLFVTMLSNETMILTLLLVGIVGYQMYYETEEKNRKNLLSVGFITMITLVLANQTKPIFTFSDKSMYGVPYWLPLYLFTTNSAMKSLNNLL